MENQIEKGAPGWVGNLVALCSIVNNQPVIHAVVYLEDGQIKTTDQKIFEDWVKEGILGRAEQGRLYPQDGQKFLDELPFMYKSPYFWAEPAAMPVEKALQLVGKPVEALKSETSDQ